MRQNTEYPVHFDSFGFRLGASFYGRSSVNGEINAESPLQSDVDARPHRECLIAGLQRLRGCAGNGVSPWNGSLNSADRMGRAATFQMRCVVQNGLSASITLRAAGAIDADPERRNPWNGSITSGFPDYGARQCQPARRISRQRSATAAARWNMSIGEWQHRAAARSATGRVRPAARSRRLSTPAGTCRRAPALICGIAA